MGGEEIVHSALPTSGLMMNRGRGRRVVLGRSILDRMRAGIDLGQRRGKSRRISADPRAHVVGGHIHACG
jgi:hypothetical protein